MDLDGTLAHYDRYHEDQRIGAPIMPMVERVRAWLAEGRSVVIFTARLSRADLNPERSRAVDEVRAKIDAWCMEQFGQRLRVTADKDYRITTFIDDRAVAVETNTGRVLGGEMPAISTVPTDPL